MEKRKPRESYANTNTNTTNDDGLALAKSAAWAWLEHCSGSDDRSTPEFDVSRTNFNRKPSRYKVEAMKLRSSNSSSMDGPLLDRYEVESISRHIDFCIKSGSGRRAAEKPQKKKISKGLALLVSHAVACGSKIDDEEPMYSRWRPENERAAVVEAGFRPWQGIRA